MHSQRYVTARNMRAIPVRPVAHHSQHAQVRPPGMPSTHHRPLNQQYTTQRNNNIDSNNYSHNNNNNRQPPPQHQPRALPFGRAGATVRFGTYNARTLSSHGEAEQLANDLAKSTVHICGLQEVRNRGIGQRFITNTTSNIGNPANGWQFIWSGHETQRRAGVGAMLAPTASRALMGWASFGDRLLTLQFAGPSITTVVVAYAPTNPSADAAKDSFYQLLKDVLDNIPEHHMTVVLGDMNAKVGRDKDSWHGIVGGFGVPSSTSPPWAAMVARPAPQPPPMQQNPVRPNSVRDSDDSSSSSSDDSSSDSDSSPSTPASPIPHRAVPPNHDPLLSATRQQQVRTHNNSANNNGRRCLQMCAAHGLLVANTFFQHRDEHTASWLSNTGRHWAAIDLVLISRRFRSSIVDTRVLPKATAHHSDHRLVVCEVRLKLKSRERGNAPARTRYNVGAVQPDSEVHQLFKNNIAAAHFIRTQSAGEPTDSQAEFAALVQDIKVAAAHLPSWPQTSLQPHTQWITQPTIQLCITKWQAFQTWQFLLGTAATSEHLEDAAQSIAAARLAYKQANISARAAARTDKNNYLQRQAQEMNEHMRAGRTHAAFRIAGQLQGTNKQHQIQAIKSASGQLAAGSQVTQVLAEHFEHTLNVQTHVDPTLLTQIIPQPLLRSQGPGPVGSIAAAAAAIDSGNQPPVTPAVSGVASGTRSTAAATARRADTADTNSQQTAQAAENAAKEIEPDLAEVQSAIKSLRNTAPGENGLSSNLLKLGGTEMAQYIHRVVTAVWRSGLAPAEWKRALLVAIHKSGSRLIADHYRGITLLEVIGKVYVSIIHNRVRNHLCNQLLDAQHGFRPGRGTSNALYTMRRLQELARDFNIPLHGAFVDFRKAFDSINRDVLWQLLAARGVAPKLVALIKDLYSGCSAQVVANGYASDWFPMATGVRQGCPMSPKLFNVFMDFVARLVSQRCNTLGVAGFKVAFCINGQLVPLHSHMDTELAMLMVLYADDMVLLADSRDGLITALGVLEQTAGEWGMALNYHKTKVMVFGSREQPQAAAVPAPAPAAAPAVNQQVQPATGMTYSNLQGGQVNMVKEFKYLGSIMEDSASQDRELNKRIQLASVAFHRLSHQVFKHYGVTLVTKMKIYKAIVVPTLLYGGAESWAPTETQLHSLNVCNTTLLRRILHIRRGPHMMSNAQMYALTKQPAIDILLKKHRLQWLGHVERMADHSSVKCLLHATAPAPVMHGGVLQEPSRLVGRPRNTWNRQAHSDVCFHGKEHSWQSDCQDRSCWKLFLDDSVLTAAP